MALQEHIQASHNGGKPSLGVLSGHAEPGVLPRFVPGSHNGDEALSALRHENAQLREALTSRAVIDQAKGVLILRYGIDEDRAFLVLQRWSQNHNVKVRRLAQALVHGICQGRHVDASDSPLLRWIEEQLRQDPDIGVRSSPP